MTKPAIRVWYALVVTALALIVIAGASVQYANHVDQKREQSEREADRRWCELLSVLDDAYKAQPPKTDIGRRLAAETNRLRREFGCANYKP